MSGKRGFTRHFRWPGLPMVIVKLFFTGNIHRSQTPGPSSLLVNGTALCSVYGCSRYNSKIILLEKEHAVWAKSMFVVQTEINLSTHPQLLLLVNKCLICTKEFVSKLVHGWATHAHRPNCRTNWADKIQYAELIDMRCQQLFPKYIIGASSITVYRTTFDRSKLHAWSTLCYKRKKNFRKIGIQRAICRHDHSTCTAPMKSLQLMEDPTDKKT